MFSGSSSFVSVRAQGLIESFTYPWNFRFVWQPPADARYSFLAVFEIKAFLKVFFFGLTCYRVRIRRGEPRCSPQPIQGVNSDPSINSLDSALLTIDYPCSSEPTAAAGQNYTRLETRAAFCRGPSSFLYPVCIILPICCKIRPTRNLLNERSLKNA